MNQIAPISPSSVVYFVQNEATGSVKIGHSTDLQMRLSSLQTSADADLRVIRTVPGGRAVERWFHKRFAHLHIKGEWFAFTACMLTEIAPDEIPVRKSVVIRRDVRLTAGERLRASFEAASGMGSSHRETLLMACTALHEDEALAVINALKSMKFASAA